MRLLAATVILAASTAALGAGMPELRVTIENHRFTPERIEVPAGKKVKLHVENKDATPEEFESASLRIEKVIPGGATGIVYVGPLKPGEYAFVGEFHEKTAHGVVVAK